jgi:hypothetical protein
MQVPERMENRLKDKDFSIPTLTLLEREHNIALICCRRCKRVTKHQLGKYGKDHGSRRYNDEENFIPILKKKKANSMKHARKCLNCGFVHTF